MNCKLCDKAIERSIEGELICSHCWSSGQDDAPPPGFLEGMKAIEASDRLSRQFEVLLNNNGINPTWTDGYDCEVAGIYFCAETYLGDLTGRTPAEIAKDLAENIKATLEEIVARTSPEQD